MRHVRKVSRLFLTCPLLIGAAALGCSGSPDGSGNDGEGNLGTGAMGSGGDGLGGSDSDYEGGPCPSEMPEPGAACENQGAYCTYGQTDRPGCREAFTCYPNGSGSGSWRADTNPADGCLVVSGPCSTTPEGACGQVGFSCHAGSEICTCSPEQTEFCGGAGCTPIDPPIPQQWSCSIPYVEPGCPQTAPNAGSQCSDTTFNCRYGADCYGIYVLCRDGFYEWEDALCP